jgi:predicted phosphate transport protein (TIGR00153 family)
MSPWEAAMLGWLRALMPREDRFFDLFEAHAKIAVEAAEAFRKLLDGGEGLAAHCDEVTRLEQKADDVAREVMLALRRSFITPFDRGDIHGLIDDMDDAVDQMRQTVQAISLFDVTSFQPDMVRIGDLIVESAKIVEATLPLLRAMNANAASINAANEKIVGLEEDSDQLYIAGLKELYQAHKEDRPMAYIVGEEIYSHLEKVVDCFEDVAARMSGILLEHL